VTTTQRRQGYIEGMRFYYRYHHRRDAVHFVALPAAAVLIVIGALRSSAPLSHGRLAAWVVVLSTTLVMGDWIILRLAYRAFSIGDAGAWRGRETAYHALFSALTFPRRRPLAGIVVSHRPGCATSASIYLTGD